MKTNKDIVIPAREPDFTISLGDIYLQEMIVVTHDRNKFARQASHIKWFHGTLCWMTDRNHWIYVPKISKINKEFCDGVMETLMLNKNNEHNNQG